MKLNTKHPAYIVVYAAVISALFTFAIMSLYAVTKDRVLQNETLARQRALVGLFDLAEVSQLSDQQISEVYRQSIVEGQAVVDPVSKNSFDIIGAYRSTDGKRELVGFAFPVWGTGFWARIDGLVAVDPRFERILGVVFLKHSETPGLGGRLTEATWRDKFKGRSITAVDEKTKVIYIGGPTPADSSDPRFNRHVDAITGATGTSSAVEQFINEGTMQFRRALQQTAQQQGKTTVEIIPQLLASPAGQKGGQ